VIKIGEWLHQACPAGMRPAPPYDRSKQLPPVLAIEINHRAGASAAQQIACCSISGCGLLL